MFPSAPSSSSSASSRKKKLVIKSFSLGATQPPADYEERTWAELSAAVSAVHAQKPVPASLQSLYQSVQNLCTAGAAARIFDALRAQCDSHCLAQLRTLNDSASTAASSGTSSLSSSTSDPTSPSSSSSLTAMETTDEPTPAQESLRDLSSSEAVSFLERANSCWQAHCRDLRMIRSVFLYLDRTYVLQQTKVRSLWDMGLQLFAENLARCDRLGHRVIQSLLVVIQMERDGDSVELGLLHSLVGMLRELGLYKSMFETPFLTSTDQYYLAESKRQLTDTESLDGAEYLHHVSNRLSQENERVAHYLAPTTRPDLLAIVEKRMLSDHVSTLLNQCFHTLMANHAIGDLKLLYSLLKRVNALDEVKKSFNAFIKGAGRVRIKDEEKDKNLVVDLLGFKQWMDRIVRESFESNDAFAYSMKEAFEAFMNDRANKPAELIAKYVDVKLRVGNRDSEEDLDSLLDRTMVLFRYVQGKDVFEAFYKKDLAKRLLLGRSASNDAERSMISKLKNECGSAFTSKLEAMFKDMELSKSLMTTFRQSSKSTTKEAFPFDLNVSVLQTGMWPTYPELKLTLPSVMQDSLNVFEAFYLSKHNGRRLHWQNAVGHCVLKAFFKHGRKELDVSLIQCVVMLLFKEESTVSYKDIQEALGADEAEVKRTLQSLACGRIRVLQKKPKGRDVNDDDVFVFNHEFRAKPFRLKINSIQLRETAKEVEETHENILQNRVYAVDAAITRIMKARKQLSHQQLMGELHKQLKFPLTASDVKQRVSSLIDREYLERDVDDPNTYIYLA